MANAPLQPFPLRDYVNGIIHENVVDEFKVEGAGAVNEAVNLHFDTMGAVRLRRGLTIIGSQINNSNVLGLFQFLDEGTGTNHQLLAGVNGTVYYWSGSAWTSIRAGISATGKMRFASFTDRVIMCNGSEATLGWVGNAGGSFDATNLSSAPVSRYIDVFRSRLWLGNVNGNSNPSRIQFSSVVSSAGALTWTSTDTIEISPGDGQDITGIKASPRALLVFKPRNTYRIYGTNETDPDPQINVGTYSQESVVSCKAGIVFHDWVNSAIQLYEGGPPKEISKPVRPFLAGMTYANRDDSASWSDFDHVYTSVGNISLNGVTFTNAVFVWTISTRTWSIYSYPNQLLAGAQYDDTATLYRVVGDTAGNIYQFDTGNTDNGTAISYSLVTHWHTLSGLRSDKKTITRLAALSRNAQGGRIECQLDFPENETRWLPVGQLEKQDSIFNTDLSFNRIRFRLSGTSSGEEFFYQGLEILEGFSERVIG